MSTEFRNPIFFQHEDGSVTVDEFHPRIWVTRELLEHPSSSYLHSAWFTRQRRTLKLHASNAEATYRLMRFDRHSNVFECTRIA